MSYNKNSKTKAAAREARAAAGMKATGRPIEVTAEVKTEILERISSGETMTDVCKSEHMPAMFTVQRHARLDPVFCAALARAREDWSNAQADLIVAIADDSSKDWIEVTFAGKTALKVDREATERSKIRILARQYLIERFNKRLYSSDATKLDPANPGDVAEQIKQDQTVIAPDEPLPPGMKPVL